MKSTELNLRYAFLCDDYRTESNGKGIAIGIYSSTIMLAQVPYPFAPFVCFVATVQESDWGFEIKIELHDRSGRVIDTAKGAVKMAMLAEQAPHPEEILVPVRMRPFNIEQDGEIVIKAKAPEVERWKVVARKSVQVVQQHAA